MATVNYIIKKGKHFHANWWQRIIRFFSFGKDDCQLVLTKECWYKKTNKDCNDLNKLHGISGLFIHKNSARVVWRPHFKNPGLFELYAYVYINGKRQTPKLLGIVEQERLIDSVVKKTKFGYRFSSYSNNWDVFIGSINPQGSCRAFPFFGGNNAAPQKMTIKITYKNSKTMKAFSTIWKVLTFQKFKSTWFISLVSWAVLAGIGYTIYFIASGQW